MFYLAENLEQRRSEFARCLVEMTGVSEEDGLREVDLSINRLFHWGAYADKYGGNVQVCMFLRLFRENCANNQVTRRIFVIVFGAYASSLFCIFRFLTIIILHEYA